MRLGRLLFFFFAGAASALAADVAQLLADARAAEAKLDSRRALELYLAADQAKPNDPAILQKIARQYSDSTLDTADLVEQKKLCDLALSYAKRAHALAPKNAVNVLSLAICYAKIGFYADNKTKIANSRLVKDYAVAALALDPDYSYAHHVLGQWHHEVSSSASSTAASPPPLPLKACNTYAARSRSTRKIPPITPNSALPCAPTDKPAPRNKTSPAP